MREMLALAGKDLRLLLRDKAGTFFVFFFPLLYAIFFGVVFSGGGENGSSIPIAVVDEDNTAGSIKFDSTLAQAAELQIQFTARENAVSLVRGGKRAAYVVLTKGFGLASERMFWGDPAKVEIGLDPSRKAEAGMLQGVLTRYFMEGFTANFSDPSKMTSHLKESVEAMNSAPVKERAYWSPLAKSLQQMQEFFAQPEPAKDTAAGQSGTKGWEPLKVEVSDVAVKKEGPKNYFEVTFPQAVLWGLIGCAAAFGIALVVERTRGTLVRLRMAPISRRTILAGKAIACFTANVAVSVLLIAVAMLIFKVRPYSLPLLGLALFSASLCFTGIMMLLSVLGKTEASASGVGWAMLTVMAMLGGGMIPLFFMPTWMRFVGNFSPAKWVIVTVEGAVWRGFSTPTMLGHCAVLVAIGLAFFVVGATIFTRRAE
jgi:ABC-2 type transport system permease protein